MTNQEAIWVFGRIPNDLVGYPATDREVPQPPSTPNPSAPPLVIPVVPMFLQKFTKQVGVMLSPRTIFIADNSMPNWNAYTVSNHVQRAPELVFQSPLDFFGLPSDIEGLIG